MPRPCPVFLLAAAVRAAPVAAAEEVVENFPDGGVRLRYDVDAEGRRHGRFQEYHPEGKLKVRAAYKAGLLDGSYTEFYEEWVLKPVTK